MRNKKILVFGNKYLEEDSLALEVAMELGMDYQEVNDSFQIITLDLNDYIILDVVKGISKPGIVSGEAIKTNNLLSLHDFDLGFILKLRNSNPIIIGLPMKYEKEDAVREVREIIRKTMEKAGERREN
jgi:hypothetical protein